MQQARWLQYLYSPEDSREGVEPRPILNRETTCWRMLKVAHWIGVWFALLYVISKLGG